MNANALKNLETTELFGFQIFCDHLENISFKNKMVINTINPHSYNTALRDSNFHMALSNSDILLPDGVGIVIANKLINKGDIKKIAGYDIFKFILNTSKNKAIKCFFLGSSPETLEKIMVRLNKEFPNVLFGAFSPPFKEEFSKDDNIEMIESINEFKPDFLFVGMTAPKQEKWTLINKEFLDVKVICNVGAVFDFYAGTTKRAPKILIENGLEWVHRSLSSTRLLKRNLISNPLFIYYMITGYLRNMTIIKSYNSEEYFVKKNNFQQRFKI